jgi:uncharacterized protein (TIGR03067 family)
MIGLFVHPAQTGKSTQQDIEKLQGEWVVTRVNDRRVNDRRESAEGRWEFEGDKVIFVDPEHPVGSYFKLFQAKSRKKIRLLGSRDWRPGDACWEGYYSLSGDTLKIRLRFREGRGSQHWGEGKDDEGRQVIVLKRRRSPSAR